MRAVEKVRDEPIGTDRAALTQTRSKRLFRRELSDVHATELAIDPADSLSCLTAKDRHTVAVEVVGFLLQSNDFRRPDEVVVEVGLKRPLH